MRRSSSSNSYGQPKCKLLHGLKVNAIPSAAPETTTPSGASTDSFNRAVGAGIVKIFRVYRYSIPQLLQGAKDDYVFLGIVKPRTTLIFY